MRLARDALQAGKQAQRTGTRSRAAGTAGGGEPSLSRAYGLIRPYGLVRAYSLIRSHSLIHSQSRDREGQAGRKATDERPKNF